MINSDCKSSLQSIMKFWFFVVDDFEVDQYLICWILCDFDVDVVFEQC